MSKQVDHPAATAGNLIEVPARQGRAVRLAAGQHLQIINTHGSQVVDTWAFNAHDGGEFMSMEHFRAATGRILPRVGDGLMSNHRRPILTLVEDTSPGIHDTLIAACDVYRYRQLGCEEGHANCTDNLHAALTALGLKSAETPCPLNLWMNIPVDQDGVVSWLPPVSRPGDHVLLRAEMDCVVVMSACPQDKIPINGTNMQPREAHYRLRP